MAKAVRRLEKARPRPIDPAPFAARVSAFTVDMTLMFFFLLTCVGALVWSYGTEESDPRAPIWIAQAATGIFLIASQLGYEAWKGRSNPNP